MPYTEDDRQILRELANEYMHYASLDIQKEKIELWKSLNSCNMQRPMVCIDQLPIYELINSDELRLKVSDTFFRLIEWDLRLNLYKWKHFSVDMVLDPYISIPKSIYSERYGISPEVQYIKLSENTTAPSQKFSTILKDYEDIEKIKDVTFICNEQQDIIHYQEAKEIFSGIAPVVMRSFNTFHLGVWDYLSQLMKVSDIYYDMYDRPEFLHACMERITNSTIAGIEKANELLIHDDNANTCHCSYIYTNELLPDSNMGKGSVSKNCWAFGLAQLFSSVSPSLFKEFELPYITKMAEYFGMIYYGCCDRLDDRLDIVKAIPNVKKISCSPWSDRKSFAMNIGKDYIMSNKPSPAFLATDGFDEDSIRKDLQYTVDLARENGVNLEIILKDISTVRNKPDRITRWAEIAMETVMKY